MTNMNQPAIRKILKVYLRIHLALMVIVTFGPILWFYFPEFFVLYGGLQAVVLWRLINKETAGPAPAFRFRSICFFSLLEVVYSIDLLFWRAQLHIPKSESCSPFSPESGTHILDYAIIPNLIFISASLIWFIVHDVKRRHANQGEAAGGSRIFSRRGGSSTPDSNEHAQPQTDGKSGSGGEAETTSAK